MKRKKQIRYFFVVPAILTFIFSIFYSCRDLSAINPSDILNKEINIYFTEYLEGSSSNHALEIYNASQVTVDLSDFEIMIYPNGAVCAISSYTLNKYLEPGGVFVIADYSSDNKIIKKADASTSSTVIKFNGNDALILVRISTGKIFDSIGCIGEKPEFCWGEGDTTTKDHTLRRKKTVQKGDNNPDDNFDPSEEWIAYSIDTFDGLGNLNY